MDGDDCRDPPRRYVSMLVKSIPSKTAENIGGSALYASGGEEFYVAKYGQMRSL